MYSPSMRVIGPKGSRGFFTIQFKHIPTKKTAFFEGWVTTFSDNFSSQWNEVPVYGRMDPLSTFMRTSRKIQLAFDVPSDSLGHAERNLQAVNDLIKFLYPVYEQQAGTGKQRVGHTIQAAPLIGLKWTNLIADASDNSELIGYLDGVNYAPKIEEGGFTRPAGGNYTTRGVDSVLADLGGGVDEFRDVDAASMSELDRRASYTEFHYPGDPTWGSVSKTDIYIPKTLSISLNFTVLHKHLPGWISSVLPSHDDSIPAEYIFGNRQVNAGFPNTQVSQRTLATSITSTEITLNEEGEKITTEVTQITSALGTEVLMGNGNS